MKNAEKIIETATKMIQSGLARGTWGNISLRENDKIWITPSGVEYHKLKPKDIAIVDIQSGKQVEGNFKASSELPLHTAIYKNYPNIKGIVHTHSVYATAYACMEKNIPCYVEDQAQIIGGEITVAKYAFPGTEELASNVVSALKNGHFGILMAKHGAVGVGRSIEEAMIAAQIIEKSAKIAYLVQTMNGSVQMSNDEIEKMRDIYLNKYSDKIIK